MPADDLFLAVIQKLDDNTVLFQPAQYAARPALHGSALCVVGPGIFIKLLVHFFACGKLLTFGNGLTSIFPFGKTIVTISGPFSLKPSC